MGPPVDPIRPDEDLPDAVEVVVIGGGIIGTATALALARRGVSVALCEKGHIAGEQSSRNWGWVRKGRRDPREIPLIVESLRMWGQMNETVEAETGFRTSGVVWGCETDADVTRYEAWLDHARPYQIDARIISGAELERHALPACATAVPPLRNVGPGHLAACIRDDIALLAPLAGRRDA